MNVILLVEDDPDILEITAYMLEDAGYQVVTASGSAQASKQAATRADISLLVTDLNLRDGISGIELSHAMRQNGLNCPVIVISGDAEPPAQKLGPGMRYLAKPFDRRTLLDLIATQLGVQGG